MIDFKPAIPGKGHFQQRSDKSSVAPVMACQHTVPRSIRSCTALKASFSIVGCLPHQAIRSPPVYSTAQATSRRACFSGPEIDIDKTAFARGFQVRGDHLCNIPARRICRYHQRSRGLYYFSLHRKGGLQLKPLKDCLYPRRRQCRVPASSSLMATAAS